MSTHDNVIANDTAANVRADINAALQALASQQSGTADPPATYSYELQARTDLGIVRRRNAANSGWVNAGTLAETFVVAKSGGYTVAQSDMGRLLDCTGTITLALTAAATMGDGWSCCVRNSGTGIVTIDPNSSEQVDGATTINLYMGESCLLECSGSAWRTVGRATGLVKIASGVISAAATLNITTGIDSQFDRYVIGLDTMVPATNNVTLHMRVSTDAGASWKSGGSDYAYTRLGNVDGGSVNVGGSAGDNKIDISTSLSNAQAFATEVLLSNPADASYYKNIKFENQYRSTAPGPTLVVGHGEYIGGTAAINGIQFYLSSGNISSGRWSLHGLR